MLGHCPTLERSDKTWKDIISDARERGCLVEVGVFPVHTDARRRSDSPFQADVNFFTRPKGKDSPKPPSKTPKRAAIESHPIPTTLVAARSIGSHGTSASPQRPHGSQSDPAATSPPSVLMPARNPPLAQPSAATPGVSLVPPKPAVQSSDTKSSRTPPALSEPTTGSVPNPTQNARPPQLVKRSKQPPSLFIPKKVRPARTPLMMLNSCISYPASSR